MKIEVLIERIEKLIKKTQESYDILYESENLLEQFEKCLSSIAKESMKDSLSCISTMVFNAGPHTRLIISEECNVYISIAEFSIPDSLKPPIVYYREELVRELLGLKEFIENIDTVVREIDNKIAEIDEKNEKLRKMLEEMKEILAPIIIGCKIRGDCNG
ncbi:MAG: hypothetical protein QXP32_09375 [Nitrososphaeria archaeon]